MGKITIGDNVCPICGTKNCDIWGSVNDPFYAYECPHCGESFFPNPSKYNNALHQDFNVFHLKSYLFYHKKNIGKRRCVFCAEAYYSSNTNGLTNVLNLSPAMIEGWYPTTFANRIDYILLYLADTSNYVGETIELDIKDLCDLFFISLEGIDVTGFLDNPEYNQLKYYIEFLQNQNYISINFNDYALNLIRFNRKHKIVILPNGLARIDHLQRNEKNNRNIFVSMSFADSTKETREAIRLGIKAANFDDAFIDEIIHNHQIIPEMFRLIRECRFLILEISEPNYGAYYEAGYALGQGKEVIVCCNADVFNRKYESEEEKCFERYLKPHFDILQKQVLIWKDSADLSKKLMEWLKELDSKPLRDNI